MSLDVEQYVRQASVEVSKASGPIAWPSGLPDHLSPSQLSMARRCPHQYKRRYLDGVKERPAEAPVIGSAVHAGVERNFRQKIESHEDLPTAALLDWYSDEGFAETLADQQERSGYEVYWDTDVERAKTRGRVMLGEYHNLVSPRIQPSGVEGSFSIDLGAPVPIVGRYDVLRDGAPTIDIKTGKRANRKPKESWRIQGVVYREATGQGVEFHSLTATDNNTVTIVTPLESEELLVNPTEAERVVLRQNVRTIAAEILLYWELLGPDQPWPTYGRFHDWACGYCGYRPNCPAWENE